jgi:hypothetical protein
MPGGSVSDNPTCQALEPRTEFIEKAAYDWTISHSVSNVPKDSEYTLLCVERRPFDVASKESLRDAVGRLVYEFSVPYWFVSDDEAKPTNLG